jgi:ligand-binding sensor domain-containing protein
MECPQTALKGMRFDSTTGFLWLATEAGLTRFNGNEFRIFNEGSQGQTITERMIFSIPERRWRHLRNR